MTSPDLSGSPSRERRPGRRKRCGAKAVFLTREEAPANSRRWLTSRRHSLFNDEDQLSPVTSLVLPHRRYQFENINSTRYDVQQFLKVEGRTNENKANSGVRSWRFDRSSMRLPVFETRRALLCGEVFVWAPDGTRGWSGFFLQKNGQHNFPRGEQATVTPYVLLLIAVPLEARLVRGGRQSPTARGYVSCGDERMSGNAMERGA